MFLEICVGVGLRVGKEKSIIIILKFVGKCKSVITSLVVSHMFSPVVILEIRDVFTTPEPTLTILFVILLRENQDLHTFIVQTFRFDVVKHVEFYPHSSSSVLYLIVKPLGVTLGVYVILQNEIVLKVRYFVGYLQVS